MRTLWTPEPAAQRRVSQLQMATSFAQTSQRLLGWLLVQRTGAWSYAAIVVWWEARRVPYNIIVGVAGLISSVVIVAVAFTCESWGGVPIGLRGASIGLPDPPAIAIVGVVLYGMLANVCYTGGWITEVLVARLWAIDTSRFGPIAFTLGTAFSVLLTLALAVLMVAASVITSCMGISGD